MSLLLDTDICSAYLKGDHRVDVDRTVSHKFGQIRAQQLDQGLQTPEMDLLIAATALVHGLTLVTHNVHDFAQIPDLNVVDWLPS